MNTTDVKRQDGRRQAEDKFTKIMKRDAAVMAYQQQQLDAEAAKISRLRALRIARDSRDAAKHRAALEKVGPAHDTKARFLGA